MKAQKKRDSVVGSLCWMAPEMFNGDNVGYSEKIDIWAFGITILEIINGSSPFEKLQSM